MCAVKIMTITNSALLLSSEKLFSLFSTLFYSLAQYKSVLSSSSKQLFSVEKL